MCVLLSFTCDQLDARLFTAMNNRCAINRTGWKMVDWKSELEIAGRESGRPEAHTSKPIGEKEFEPITIMTIIRTLNMNIWHQNALNSFEMVSWSFKGWEVKETEPCKLQKIYTGRNGNLPNTNHAVEQQPTFSHSAPIHRPLGFS